MNKDEQKRFGKGLAVAFVVHLFACLFIGILGVTFVTKQPHILEVSLTGGGGGSPEVVEQEEYEQQEEPEIEDPEDIIDQKKKPVLKKKPVQRSVQKSDAQPSPNANPDAKPGDGDGSSEGDGKGSGGGQGDGSGVAQGEGVPITPPRPLKTVEPRYPSSARNRSIEGTVMVRMLVNAKGYVDEAYVAQSSGNTELDEAAVEAVYGWRFSPAKDTLRQKVSCYITVPINFRLRR